jgi:DNA mismatch repair protein MutS
MAQVGSFVPAKSAKIGVVDKIFTRVGASDDLASGQSTFMLEMLEVANILKNATSKSFLVFDEIGRGTSTYDGMSIAKAVVEYVADKKKLGAKTLFATHYHELCELADIVPGVVNYNVAVKRRGDDIIFLKKIVPGGTDDSFGIEVAALAGVDKWIVDRAKDILGELEKDGKVKIITKTVEASPQISMLDMNSNKIIEELKQIDVTTMTPIEAMSCLYKLSNSAKE